MKSNKWREQWKSYSLIGDGNHRLFLSLLKHKEHISWSNWNDLQISTCWTYSYLLLRNMSSETYGDSTSQASGDISNSLHVIILLPFIKRLHLFIRSWTCFTKNLEYSLVTFLIRVRWWSNFPRDDATKLLSTSEKWDGLSGRIVTFGN